MDSKRKYALAAMATSWREHIVRSGGMDFAAGDDIRRYVTAAGSQIGRWFGLGTAAFETMLDEVSFTLPPIPGLWSRPVALMARSLEERPVDDIETATHEWTHGRDLSRLFKNAGPLPAEVNYCILYASEKQARAQAEGKAYVAGLAAKYRITGQPFTPADVTGRMHRLYLLGDEDFTLIDDMTRSDIKSIERAGAPPHATALEFIAWAEDSHPELLAELPPEAP